MAKVPLRIRFSQMSSYMSSTLSASTSCSSLSWHVLSENASTRAAARARSYLKPFIERESTSADACGTALLMMNHAGDSLLLAMRTPSWRASSSISGCRPLSASLAASEAAPLSSRTLLLSRLASLKFESTSHTVASVSELSLVHSQCSMLIRLGMRPAERIKTHTLRSRERTARRLATEEQHPSFSHGPRMEWICVRECALESAKVASSFSSAAQMRL